MKLDAKALLPPLLAALVLIVVVTQTLGALRASGVWSRDSMLPAAHGDDPYARLDDLIARRTGGADIDAAGDPFAPGAPAADAPTKPVAPKPVKPVAPPAPVLTSIVWDADPRATVRWDGRDYSIRENSLFADFRVVSIARGQVVLERGGERITLALPKKGE